MSTVHGRFCRVKTFVGPFLASDTMIYVLPFLFLIFWNNYKKASQTIHRF